MSIRSLPCVPLVAAVVFCSACSKPPPLAGDGQVTAATAAANAATAEAYDLADRSAYDDAARGFIAAPSGQVTDATGRVIWDFADFDFLDGAAPPTVNPSLWRQALLNNHVGLFKVAEGIHQLRGFDLANITLIDGQTGWIVVDPLTSRETAAFAMAFARQHLGERPVSAIVFTHSHADHFGGVLGVVSAAQAAESGIPVVAPEGFMEEATSENLLMGVAMSRRAMYMYGSRLPRAATGLVDNGLGKAVAFGSVGILQPNRIVTATPEEITLDGVRFVFQNVPRSEAPAELTFMLPDLGAYCGAELVSQTLHNIYTPRGAKVRDARLWSQYIDEAIGHAAQAGVYFGSHHWPVWGQPAIREFLVHQRDAFAYLHDQTVRMMNAGMTAREIAEEMRMPPSLDRFLAVHGYYGTVRHNVKGIYQFYLGWFDANPANLDPLPPQEAARRYVALAGGTDPAVAAAQAAFDAGEYRWAAEILNHVVHAQPDHTPARTLLARTYDQLGYAAESAVWRNFYLSGAFELRNGAPETGTAKTLLLDLFERAPIERFLEAMAASLDGPAAAGLDLKVNLVFSDLGTSYVLWIENAVLHFRKAAPAADANATLTLTKPFFLRMVTGSAGAAAMLTSDETDIEGSTIDLGRFFGLIQKAPGNFAIVEP